MVEIPATAALADVFAKRSRFLHCTNDLIQYTLAADRMSERDHIYTNHITLQSYV